MRVSSLPQAVTWNRTGWDSNPWPFGSRANALPLRHTGHQLSYPKEIRLCPKIKVLPFGALCQTVDFVTAGWPSQLSSTLFNRRPTVASLITLNVRTRPCSVVHKCGSFTLVYNTTGVTCRVTRVCLQHLRLVSMLELSYMYFYSVV